MTAIAPEATITAGRPLEWPADTPDVSDPEHVDSEWGPHMLRRGSSRAAAQLFRQIIATDARAQIAHELDAETGPERLPMRVAALLIDRRTHTVQTRQAAYRRWCSKAQERSADHEHSTDQHLHQSLDYGLKL